MKCDLLHIYDTGFMCFYIQINVKLRKREIIHVEISYNDMLQTTITIICSNIYAVYSMGENEFNQTGASTNMLE